MSIFTKVLVKKPKKSAFNLSHERKFSCNMGELVPILCQEVIPGDNFKIRLEQLVRFQALKSPMMHRVDVTTHFFFVPNRLLWNKWEEFITGGEDGNSNPVFPKFAYMASDSAGMPIGGLLDHLGFPVQQMTGVQGDENIFEFNVLPIRAYYLIYNEYFRDQNVGTEYPVDLGSGVKAIDDIIYNNGHLLKRAWEKDYFTSALPWAQRGTQVSINTFGENARVGVMDPDFYGLTLGNDVDYAGEEYTVHPEHSQSGLKGKPLVVDNEAQATTINELRRAYRLQEWLEKNARGGSRYIEQILSHFGVRSSDSRLQRPEYLGGGKTPVVLSEVLQNSETSETSPQGNMAGHGVSAGSSPYFKKYCEEHGYIIGLLSVTPKPAYMQGVPKIFSKFDKFDYYWPEFDALGEQPINKQELYFDCSATAAENMETFGYTPRYAEYRFIPSTVHGDMRTSLKFWHMANDYSEAPNLNRTFIECDPTHRVFAVEDKSYQKLIVQTYADIKAIRPMSKFAIPKL